MRERGFAQSALRSPHIPVAQPRGHLLLLQQFVEHAVEAFVPINVRRHFVAAASFGDALCILMPETAGWAAALSFEGVPDMAAMALPIGLSVGTP